MCARARVCQLCYQPHLCVCVCVCVLAVLTNSICVCVCVCARAGCVTNPISVCVCARAHTCPPLIAARPRGRGRCGREPSPGCVVTRGLRSRPETPADAAATVPSPPEAGRCLKVSPRNRRSPGSPPPEQWVLSASP